ncbi:LppX_LprAFG lipoprotein [Streptomyces sp. NPDC006393]|uniref:LppX_LprAFG lipoprotein n=1 Tax=Streptomyces sp. NPDC006393 TaxID=3156763 RepID=UPI0033FB754E
MGTSVRRAGGAGLAGLLLAAGAVGCSKGEESPAMTPAAAVAKAATNAETVTSLRYRMTGQVPEQGRIKADAEMRLKPTVAMSMKMTVPAQGTDQAVEMRLVGKAMYLNGGAEAAKEMDGKSWIKFDLSGTGAGKELDQLGSASPQAQQNPAAESTFLTGAKDTKKVGTETVDGVSTTHYKGTATVDELVKAMKEQDKGKDATLREGREKSLAQYEKLGIDKLTMDMWIDGENHTKRFRLRGDGTKGPLDMTITFLGFNEPVKVTAPPAADTADLAEMMKDAGAE